MAGTVLTNQLKSLNNACQQLQERIGSDAKAAELLFCVRGLVTQLTVENETAPKLAAKAREALAGLQPAIRRLGVEIAAAGQAGDLASQLHAVRDKMAAIDTAEAASLCRQLALIEAEYLEALDQAFQSAYQPPAAAQAAVAGIDKAALRGFLAQVFTTPDLVVESVDIISGGFSKQTMKVQLRKQQGVDGPLPETLILRLDLPAETALAGTKVIEEYPMLQAAHRHGIRVPKPYALEASGKVAGRSFIVLGLVTGRTVGTLFNYPPADAGLGVDIAHQLAAIHSVPISALGTDVMGPEMPLIERIREEIAIARRFWEALGRSSTIMEEGFRVLERHLPLAEGSTRCLVHGDFGLHNIMVEDNKVSAILDWEFGKLGNPADDLGYFHDTAEHLMGWDNFLAEYARAGGIVPSLQQIQFYRLLALVRVCTLASQADAAFCAGVMTRIQYAPPGSYFLRGIMAKLGRHIQRMA